MREFCWKCHRPMTICFCAQVREFDSDPELLVLVHPEEVASTVGTAWILRRSIRNLHWIRTNGHGLDRDEQFLKLLSDPALVPLVLFPGEESLNLSRVESEQWRKCVPAGRRPLMIVVDGTWTQAKAMIRRSELLKELPRVSFEHSMVSEYQFKTQPRPECLSTLESTHRLMEVLAQRGWGSLPSEREHDRLIEIFREMVRFQLAQERKPRFIG